MCASAITACKHEDCTACQTDVGNCVNQHVGDCIQIDGSLPTFDSGGGDASCTNPGPQCAALATCCSQISAASAYISALKSQAMTCSDNANSCDESECRQTATAVNTLASGFFPNGICMIPDAG
jgi:hypothetical protein